MQRILYIESFRVIKKGRERDLQRGRENWGRISIGQSETNNHRKITKEGKKFTTNGCCLV